MIFPYPDKNVLQEQNKHRILPIFIPFAGCPQRCIFCGQDIQTGHAVEPSYFALEHVQKIMLQRAEQDASPIEIAFYGGTFTALDRDLQLAFLDRAKTWKEKGLVTGVRCSTRPDCIDYTWLCTLKKRGLDMVELGVQSFYAEALHKSRRGYEANAVYEAVASLKQAGMPFGIQLLPAMPEVSPEIFLDDMQKALDLAPLCMRLYPCLVLEQTGLATWWREGRYIPWSLETTVSVLAKALLMAWKADVNIIRIGLNQDEALEKAVLAGPMHPALGGMVKSEALLLYIAEKTEELDKNTNENKGPYSLRVPRRWRGLFWGHSNNLVKKYEVLGLRKDDVTWHDEEYFEIKKA